MKLTVYTNDSNDYAAAYLDGEMITLSDSSLDNVYRFASYLRWEIEIIVLTRKQFEAKFC